MSISRCKFTNVIIMRIDTKIKRKNKDLRQIISTARNQFRFGSGVVGVDGGRVGKMIEG
jgi:hypothetical protein